MEFSDSDRLEIRAWVDSCLNIKSKMKPTLFTQEESLYNTLYVALYTWNLFPKNDWECLIMLKMIKTEIERCRS